MKKILFLTLIVGALLFTASCDKKGVIYEFPSDAQLLSFPSDVATFSMVSEDGNKITVYLYRGNTKGAISVPFSFADGTDGVFTPAKTTFDFEDGQGVASVDINYPDINAFGGETYEMVLSIDENQVSPSGEAELKVKAQRKLTLKKLGTGTFNSYFWFEVSFPQDVYNAEEAPNYYVLPDCYADGTDITFTVKDGKPIFANPFFTGYLVSGFQLWVALESAEIDGNTVVMNCADFFLPEYGNYSFGGGVETFEFPAGVAIQ